MFSTTHIRILLLLLLALAAFQLAQGDLLEDVVIRGWVYDAGASSGPRIHYEVHIAYKSPARGDVLSAVRSIEVTIGKQRIVFPAVALDASSRYWETPRGVWSEAYRKGWFSLFFQNCGDGARCYTLEFLMHGGRVVSEQVTPALDSEVQADLIIFDAQGRIVYNGPCNEKGWPTGKMSKEAKLALK